MSSINAHSDHDDDRSVHSIQSVQSVDSAMGHRYELPERVSVMFDGTRSFWRTRCKLDVIVVHHEHLKTVEIISYDPCLGVEAPRIYVDRDIVKARIDRSEMKHRLAARKESNLRQKVYMRGADIVEAVTNEMILSFLFTRMDVHTADEHNRNFRIALTPLNGDEIVTIKMDNSSSGKYSISGGGFRSVENKSVGDGGSPNSVKVRSWRGAEPVLDCVIARPLGLSPLVVHSRKAASIGEMAMALNLLRSDHVAMQEATYVASLAMSSTRGFKSMLKQKRTTLLQNISKARWRLAIRRTITRQAVTRTRRALLDGNSAISEWYRNQLKQQRRSSRRDSSSQQLAAAAASAATATDAGAVAARGRSSSSVLHALTGRSSATAATTTAAVNGPRPDTISELSESQQRALEREERIQQARQKRMQERRNRRTFDNGADGAASDDTSKFLEMIKNSPDKQQQQQQNGDGLFPSPSKDQQQQQRCTTASSESAGGGSSRRNSTAGSSADSDSGKANAATAAATASLPKLGKARMGPSTKDIKGVFFGSGAATQPRQRRTDEELRAMRMKRPNTASTDEALQQQQLEQQELEQQQQKQLEEEQQQKLVAEAAALSEKKQQQQQRVGWAQSHHHNADRRNSNSSKMTANTSSHYGSGSHHRPRGTNSAAAAVSKERKLPKLEDDEHSASRGHFWDLGQQLLNESTQNKYLKQHENGNIARDDPFFKAENQKHRTLFPGSIANRGTAAATAGGGGVVSICSMDDDDSIGFERGSGSFYDSGDDSAKFRTSASPDRRHSQQQQRHQLLPPTHPHSGSPSIHLPSAAAAGTSISPPGRHGQHKQMHHSSSNASPSPSPYKQLFATAGAGAGAFSSCASLSSSLDDFDDCNNIDDDDDDATVELGWQPSHQTHRSSSGQAALTAPSLMQSYSNSMVHLQQNVPIKSFASVQLSLEKFNRSGKQKTSKINSSSNNNKKLPA